MNARIFFWSLTSALAGFLFGFDTVVISGAEKTIQALWGLSPDLHGIAMASALYGTVVGSLLGGWPADRFGRKGILVTGLVIFTIASFFCGAAPDLATLVTARAFQGMGAALQLSAALATLSSFFRGDERGRGPGQTAAGKKSRKGEHEGALYEHGNLLGVR